MSGRYGKGLHRPDPAKLARRLHAGKHPALVARVAVGSTPNGSAQLQACPRLDQGQTGTCHAHSAAAAVWTALNAAGKPLPFIPSPLLIASTTYADVQGPADKRDKLQDTGADLSDDAKALATWGIAPMRGPTSDGRNSDVENDPPDNSFPEPDASQISVAGSDLIAGEYSIPVDADAPRLCALALDSGIPIWLGFFCDTAFENLTPSDVAQPPNEADPNGGGHAVVLAGYRTAADGSYEFHLVNSWGAGWCDNGTCWVSTAWLLKCWMLFLGAVK